MFGDMVFEMTRSCNKVQFKLREPLERLYASIRMVRIPLDVCRAHSAFAETGQDPVTGLERAARARSHCDAVVGQDAAPQERSGPS